MYMILQHLYVTSKHVELYIKNRPKLLFSAVVLFGLIWSILGPTGGADKLVFLYLHKDEFSTHQQVLAGYEKMSMAQDPTYISSNSLGALVKSVGLDEADDTAYLDTAYAPVTVQNNALIASAGPITFITQEARDEAISYVVQQGDVPSIIAASHGISTYTLLWANKLSDGSLIRPGDELLILPVSGVSHTVKDGDTIGSIAKKYEATEKDILAFNNLPANGAISIGQALVVPDGVMPAPPRPVARYVASSGSSYVTGPGTGKSRAYPYGQCTWYVAQQRYVPWNGHAKSWLANAQAMGFSVCWGSQCTPQAGAIVSLNGSSWLSRLYGHVAYVESVSDGWFTISEMNHKGWAIKSVRTISTDSSAIGGFIY